MRQANDNVQKKPSSRPFSKHFISLILVLVSVSFFFQAACSDSKSESSTETPPVNSNIKLPTGTQSANEPEDGQWLMAAKNYANTRFSGLD